MANKTTATADDVNAFLSAAPHTGDARALAALMEEIAGEPATMWGSSIVGYGSYRYRTAGGREEAMCRIGFSPRKAALTLYVDPGGVHRDALLAALGPHTAGKSCVYVKRLADVDRAALRALIEQGLAASRERHPD